MNPLVVLSSFIAGCVTATVLIRYGMSLVRTQDGLPAFGKEYPPPTQTHTNEEEKEE